MKKSIFFIAISFFCSSSYLCAGKSLFDPYTYSGSVELENKTIPHLTLDGASQLSHVTVQNTLKAKGALIAKNCLFRDVISSANLQLHATTVEGKASIQGTLIANSSSFHDALSIKGALRTILSQYTGPVEVRKELDAEDCLFNLIQAENDVRLLNTNAYSITCRSLKPQSVFLQGTSEVLQDIVFTTASGTVFAERKEQIRGTIHGGTLTLRPSSSVIKNNIEPK